MGNVDDLVTGALPPLAGAVTGLNPATLWAGSTVRIEALERVQAPLAQAEGRLTTLSRQVAAVPTCGLTGRITGLRSARSAVVTRTGGLRVTVSDAALAARLAPTMLGAAGTRRYLLVVDNDAESRATGGIIGGLGLLTVSRGRLDLGEISGNNNLPGGDSQSAPAMRLPAQLVARYGPFAPSTEWGNANLSPDYPTSSTFYTALYRTGTGITVDGTITIDPTTLSYLISATQPAVLADGRKVTGADFVELVESRVYADINDIAKRDAFFAATGRAAYQAVLSGHGDAAAVLAALGRATGEGRLLVASNHPAEEALLATTPLGGALPDTPGPFLAVVTQNAAASKLDYWTRRATDYTLVRRPDGTADATITVRVTNTAPPHLPAYVTLRQDPGAPPGNPREQNRLWVSVYTGVLSGLESATLDGRPVRLDRAAELGHPVDSTWISIDAGQTRTLVLRVREPTWARTLLVRPQPQIIPERLRVRGAVPVTPYSALPDR